MPRMRKDCPLYGKKDLCKLSNHLANIHRLSSVGRRFYMDDVKSSCAEEEDHDITPRSKRARMDDYDEGATTSSDNHNGDIFDSDDEQKEYSSEEEEEEEESNSEEDDSNEEDGSNEEDDSNEESEEGDHQASENGEDNDPWQTLIHKAKLQLLEIFQENVEYLKNEELSEDEAQRQLFLALLPN